MTNSTPLPPQQPSSTLVNIAEHAELRLVRILATSPQQTTTTTTTTVSPTFESECESHIANADAPSLIRTIIHDHGALTSLFSITPTDDAVSAFSLLAALLDRVSSSSSSSANEEESLAVELADAVSADGFEPSKRIAMLSALYNLRSRGVEKCRLLGRIVTLCGEFERGALVEGGELWDVLESGSVEQMLRGWGEGVGVGERRGLYRSIGGAYGRVEGGGVRRQKYLLLDVASYTDKAEIDKEALISARECTIGAIRDPVTLFSEQRGMLTLPAVMALRNNPATEPLYTLLQIVQEGKLTDYQSHLKSHPTLLSTHSLSPETLHHNMCLLSLCSLAAEHEEIPYAAIAQTLHIPLDDVESWVIAAVSVNLLSAKMDQLSQVVMVERCVVRKFDLEEWKRLKTRLDYWKSSVRQVLDGLNNGQSAVAGM